MTRDELRRLIKSEDYSYPWEKEPVDSSINEIDDNSLKSYFDEAVGCGRLTLEKYDKEELLSVLELYKNSKLNNAAIALFGVHANVSLKLSTFATNEKLTFTDLKVIRGNIYQLYDKAVKYVSEHMNWRMEISTKSDAVPEIPLDAIREIIVNAFAHAIYEPVPEIEVNIFPGMINIINPGSFPDDLTPMDFVNKNISSIKRNPLILDILYRCKNVEKSGTGFKRMNKSCQQNGIKWNCEMTAYCFSFTFYRKSDNFRVTDDVTLNQELSETENTVYQMIKNNVKITREDISKHLKKTVRTVQRITNALVLKGYIARIGNNRFGYWEIIK